MDGFLEAGNNKPQVRFRPSEATDDYVRHLADVVRPQLLESDGDGHCPRSWLALLDS